MPSPSAQKVKDEFKNSDRQLLESVDRTLTERKRLGLDGLIGGLEAVIINTELTRLKPAVQELMRTTGLGFAMAFEDDAYTTCLLQAPGSADFLLRARKREPNPFSSLNQAPKAQHLPNTRLETFVFRANDLDRFTAIQKNRGQDFLSRDIIRTPSFDYIQTPPSPYTGNALGFVTFKGERSYLKPGSRVLDWSFPKPELPHLSNIFELDHCATRITAQDRDAAITEFLALTSYHFEFAIYVETLNSITNVTRLSLKDYAMVFTSGIEPYREDGSSGPTEQFIANYGRRVHHMAFRTEDIDATYQALKDDGMEFLVELVGSPEDGLKQTFSMPSPNTLLVNEYIHRYGDFDGFFTRSNVTMLTKATERQ
ncbi:MAG: VOC family protein [Desulfohalobiaceae bacterium]